MYAYHVVPYAPEHRDELRAVCLAQAGEHANASEAHRRFTLLMYCDAYLERGVAYTLRRTSAPSASTSTWVSCGWASTTTVRASRSACGCGIDVSCICEFDE